MQQRLLVFRLELDCLFAQGQLSIYCKASAITICYITGYFRTLNFSKEDH